MSQNLEIFYNLFWKDEACYNLFMLSKDELLEIEDYNGGTLTFHNNKIIISNKEESSSQNVLVNRNSTSIILAEISMRTTFDTLEPMVKNLIESKFGKAFSKLQDEIEKNGVRLTFKVIKALLDEKNRDKKLLTILKDFGFINHNISSFQQLDAHMEKLFIPSKDSAIINRESIIIYNEVVRTIRELLANHAYKKFYTSNQILVNSLNKDDNYKSRIRMFSDLYDAKIILSSNQKSFVECTNCDSDVLKGELSMKINPKKLEKFKCPSCSHELTYHAVYELTDDIFQIVKSNDGVILDALCFELKRNKIQYYRNIQYLNDIEIDCWFEKNGNLYLIETKMFKINNAESKYKQKANEAYGRLKSTVSRLSEIPIFKGKILKPVLLLNWLNQENLNEWQNLLERENDLQGNPRLCNLKEFQKILEF